MTFLLILVAEIFILFLSSKTLVNSTARIVYSFSGSRKTAAHVLAFLFLPGTIIHELSHILMAGVMLVHTGEIEFEPEIDPNGAVKLGSAQVGKTDPLRMLLIGVAPVILGLTLITTLLYYLSLNLGDNLNFWQILLSIYGVFIIGNTMFSSKKDLEGALAAVVALILVLSAIYFLGLKEPFYLLSNFINQNLSDYLKRIDLFLLAPLILNLVIIFLSKLFVRRVLF